MAEQPTAAPQKQLLLQKIYVKDLSFESPKAPLVFTSNIQPQTQLNVRSSSQQVAPDTQEVTLTITVEAKDKDSTLFVAEVKQAGIFPTHARRSRTSCNVAASRRCCCNR
jgi:preprotein translocase subunit SecB